MNIKAIKGFNIGSSCFFESYNDYKIHDKDVLIILDHGINGKKSFIFKKDEHDVIFYPKLTKDEYIEEDINANDPLKIGKYLVPEFIQYINLEISDLRKLSSLLDKLDEAHEYEKIIYNSYIENNSFTLTDDQRLAAYNEYKKYRNDI